MTRVVFVVGARRSGTTWVQRVLAAPDHVLAVPAETHLLSHGVSSLYDHVGHALVASPRVGQFFMDPDEFTASVRAFCDSVFDGYRRRLLPDAHTIVERSPWHVFALDRLAVVYPEAPVVHALRDPRDVVRSLLALDWGPDDVSQAVDEWARAVDAVARAEEAGHEIVTVRYEDLLRAERGDIRDLLGRCGLPVDDASVDAAVAAWSAAENVDPSSPGVQAEKWRAGLAPEIVAEIESRLGSRLVDAGYEASAGAPPDPHLRVDPRPAVRAAVRALRRLRSLAPGRSGRSGPAPAVRDTAWEFEAALSALRTGSTEPMQHLLASPATVHLSGWGPPRRYQGADRMAQLLAVVEGDAGLSGPLRHGTLHAGSGLVVAVQEFDDGGRPAVVTWVARIEGGAVVDLNAHRAPSVESPR